MVPTRIFPASLTEVEDAEAEPAVLDAALPPAKIVSHMPTLGNIELTGRTRRCGWRATTSTGRRSRSGRAGKEI